MQVWQPKLVPIALSPQMAQSRSEDDGGEEVEEDEEDEEEEADFPVVFRRDMFAVYCVSHWDF